jgi:hypothetical protein
MDPGKPLPLDEEGARRTVAEGAGEDAAAAMPLPLNEEAFIGSPEPVLPEEVERRIEESKRRIEKSSSEESGQESSSSS